MKSLLAKVLYDLSHRHDTFDNATLQALWRSSNAFRREAGDEFFY